MKEIPFAHTSKIGRTVDYVSGRNRYIGYLISLGLYSFKGVKSDLTVRTEVHGTSQNPYLMLWEQRLMLSMQNLMEPILIIMQDLHILAACRNSWLRMVWMSDSLMTEMQTDVFAIDEKGNLVDGDAILYIYGKYMKERGKLENNTVVTTVMSNFGLYKAFDEAGIGYAKTAVGDKYVYEYMTKNGCILGGEQSGHIIFSKYASTGDGILTSLKMMEVMMARKKKMSELLDGLTIYPQVLENVRVTDKKAAQDDADVQAAVKAVTEALGDTGRILVRESGTEPLLRVMVEAETEEVCRKYVDQVVDVVKAKGHIAS